MLRKRKSLDRILSDRQIDYQYQALIVNAVASLKVIIHRKHPQIRDDGTVR